VAYGCFEEGSASTAASSGANHWVMPRTGHGAGSIGREVAISGTNKVAARRGDRVAVHSDDLLGRVIRMHAEGIEVPCLGTGAGHAYPYELREVVRPAMSVATNSDPTGMFQNECGYVTLNGLVSMMYQYSSLAGRRHGAALGAHVELPLAIGARLSATAPCEL